MSPLPADWAEALAAQGVPETEIAEAKAIAARQAEAAREVPHDPLEPAAPAAFLALLREAAE